MTIPIDSPPKVLIIDDETSVRDALVDILELIEVKTVPARDGEEGIHLFSTHLNDIELIILDLTMPKLSGKETFRALRELASDIPIIISSGRNIAEICDEFSADNHCEYIQKPFTIDSLLERVQRHLKNST
ncbi:MAG: response regulator [Chloroflexota bacterium]